jgi:hypothetical protein
MSHKSWKTPSPTDLHHRWKIFPDISRYPLAADFESPEDLVIVGHLSESQYRQLKPHRSMSDDSEREKAFTEKLRQVKSKDGDKKKEAKVTPTTATPHLTCGPCTAMGSFCPFPDLQNNQHFCNGCGKGMHVIAPRSGAYDGETDTHLCGMGEYMADKEVTKTSTSKLPVAPKKLSRDMLLESDSGEELEFEVESGDEVEMMPPLAAVAAVAAAAAAAAKKPPAAAIGKRRGPNFGNDEDTFITRAWCAATEDSRKGSGQKQQDFNETLFSNYVSLCDEYNGQVIDNFKIPLISRNQKGIIDRFAKKIKKASSQFAGVVSRNEIKSGDDKVNQAHGTLLPDI